MNSLSISVLVTVLLSVACSTEKIRYIATEHPQVTYVNNKYMSYLNLTSKRYGRADPFYYVGLNMYFVSTFSNNVTVDFYFYEFMMNRYIRGFLEMHLKFCDLIEKDKFFGTALRQGKFTKPCPYGPGAYYLSNMTLAIKHIPRNFPFTKGRIYCNITATVSKEIIASGHIDMEIKDGHIKKKN